MAIGCPAASQPRAEKQTDLEELGLFKRVSGSNRGTPRSFNDLVKNGRCGMPLIHTSLVSRTRTGSHGLIP